LVAVGLSSSEVDGIMGDNWYRFYAENFAPDHL
jgi:membrane dipeptidase